MNQIIEILNNQQKTLELILAHLKPNENNLFSEKDYFLLEPIKKAVNDFIARHDKRFCSFSEGDKTKVIETIADLAILEKQLNIIRQTLTKRL